MAYPYDFQPGFTMYNQPFTQQNFQPQPPMQYQIGAQNMQNAQNRQPGTNVVTIQSIKQVEQVPVPPGRQVLVMVQNDPVIAMRTADQIGLVQTIFYKIEQFNPEDSETKKEEYATKSEFMQLQGIVQEIVNGLTGGKANESAAK